MIFCHECHCEDAEKRWGLRVKRAALWIFWREIFAGLTLIWLVTNPRPPLTPSFCWKSKKWESSASWHHTKPISQQSDQSSYHICQWRWFFFWNAFFIIKHKIIDSWNIIFISVNCLLSSKQLIRLSTSTWVSIIASSLWDINFIEEYNSVIFCPLAFIDTHQFSFHFHHFSILRVQSITNHSS